MARTKSITSGWSARIKNSCWARCWSAMPGVTAALLQYCLNGIELPETPDALILPHRSDESVGAGSGASPASAQICSCYDVTKGAICSAIRRRLHHHGSAESGNQGPQPAAAAAPPC